MSIVRIAVLPKVHDMRSRIMAELLVLSLLLLSSSFVQIVNNEIMIFTTVFWDGALQSSTLRQAARPPLDVLRRTWYDPDEKMPLLLYGRIIMIHL